MKQHEELELIDILFNISNQQEKEGEFNKGNNLEEHGACSGVCHSGTCERG